MAIATRGGSGGLGLGPLGKQIAGLGQVTRDLIAEPPASQEALNAAAGEGAFALVEVSEAFDAATAAFTTGKRSRPGGGWPLIDGAVLRLKKGLSRSNWTLFLVDAPANLRVPLHGGQFAPYVPTNPNNAFNYYRNTFPSQIGDAVSSVELYTTDQPTNYEGKLVGSLADGIVTADALAAALVARLLPTQGLSLGLNFVDVGASVDIGAAFTNILTVSQTNDLPDHFFAELSTGDRSGRYETYFIDKGELPQKIQITGVAGAYVELSITAQRLKGKFAGVSDAEVQIKVAQAVWAPPAT